MRIIKRSSYPNLVYETGNFEKQKSYKETPGNGSFCSNSFVARSDLYQTTGFAPSTVFFHLIIQIHSQLNAIPTPEPQKQQRYQMLGEFGGDQSFCNKRIYLSEPRMDSEENLLDLSFE